MCLLTSALGASLRRLFYAGTAEPVLVAPAEPVVYLNFNYSLKENWYKIREATNYAPPLRLILNRYRAPQPTPTFVIFLTDGGNADKPASAEAIRELSSQPVFVQFVGIGKEDFPFLRKLDELTGRFIDNAGFMPVNDIDVIKDAELYDRLLNEFPQWLEAARENGILAA